MLGSTQKAVGERIPGHSCIDIKEVPVGRQMKFDRRWEKEYGKVDLAE